MLSEILKINFIHYLTSTVHRNVITTGMENLSYHRVFVCCLPGYGYLLTEDCVHCIPLSIF